MLTEKYPGRPIVQVNEAVFQGALPITQEAQGIKPTATLGLGVVPMVLTSIDTAPYGPAILPDSSPAGRERNKAMQKQVFELFFGEPMKAYCEVFKELGAHEPPQTCVDAPYLFVDRFLQMCIPSAEYVRSDMPASVRFTGGLPRGPRDNMVSSPAWWKELVENVDKEVIFVCQGTLTTVNYNDLIIPTLKALEDRPNTLVIVAVGKKGGSLPEGTHIPENARVADFIPFDEVLPHSHVFVTNGGYGAFQHGISNGVPLIVAGAGEDKPETCARAEWCGIAINLRTGSPTKEAILEGIEELIREPKYKKRALEMKAEMDGFDPMSIVSQTIDELAIGKHLN
jgi:UDP:flavonoid glycosyltransferase YjiC (YdhE family)